MGRVCTVFAGVVMVGLVATASAAPTRKVKIETDPEGATVYLEAKEDGPVCTPTPCSFDAPVGDTPIIIELEGHEPKITMLTVPSRGRLQPFPYKLEAAIGTVIVDGPEGASITISEIDRGKAPVRVEVPAGPHIVQFSLDGRNLEPQAINVPAGGEINISGSMKDVAIEIDDEEDRIVIDDGGGGGGATVKKATDRARRGRIFVLSAAMDIGFRDFVYDQPMTDNLRKETERGQVLVGPYIELWPFTLFGIHALRGFSVMGRFGYGVNSQTVLEEDGTETDARTYWRAFEASARHRWTIANTATIEVSFGFVRDQYQFEGEIDAIELVPDADYQSIRFGARGSFLLGAIEPYGSFENRVVLSGGTLERRFEAGSDVSGLRAAVGFAANLGPVPLRVEGSLTRYAWTFKTDSSMDEFQAAGGVDSIKTVTAVIGYAY